MITSCASSRIQEELYLTREKVSLLENQNANLEKRVDNLFAQISNLISRMDVFNNKIKKNSTKDIDASMEVYHSNKANIDIVPQIHRNKKSVTIISDYNGRCQAITKKGTQCKRTAKPGSKYCWQHGN